MSVAAYLALLGGEEGGGTHRWPQCRGHDDTALLPDLHPSDALLKACGSEHSMFNIPYTCNLHSFAL